jgi:hypothetical protein
MFGRLVHTVFIELFMAHPLKRESTFYRQFQEEIKQMTKELIKLSNISIKEDSTPFIKKNSVNLSGNLIFFLFQSMEI